MTGKTNYQIGKLIVKDNHRSYPQNSIQFPLNKEKAHEMLEEVFMEQQRIYQLMKKA